MTSRLSWPALHLGASGMEIIIIKIIRRRKDTGSKIEEEVLAFHADRDRWAATLSHGIDRLARVLACMSQSEHPQRQRVRGYQRSVGHIVLQSIILQRSNPVRWCFVLPREGETRSPLTLRYQTILVGGGLLSTSHTSFRSSPSLSVSRT